MKLNQVTLPVSDMDAAVAFYKSLGFTQIVANPLYARFESIDGDATFSLQLEAGPFSNGAVIYFETNQLDDVYQSLCAQGITFDQPPADMSYLWREAILHDPSGNKIKLYWAGENRLNPPWRLDANN